jgi:aminoglycoside phosphotransferase (APT) family kinase protein
MNNPLGQPIAQGRTAEIFSWGEGKVLKLFRTGIPRGACDHEFSISKAVQQSGVPAPIAFEQIEVESRPGIVYERVEGHTMLRELSAHPERLHEMAQWMADLHAHIHQLKAEGLPRARDRFAWTLQQAPLHDAQKAAIAQHVAGLADDDKVCHGDFHPDNIVLTPAGLRVIDWNNATAGHPLADVAWTSLILRMGAAPPGSEAEIAPLIQARLAFHEAYLARRLGAHRDELSAWMLPIMVARLADNIPEEREQLLRMIDEAMRL